MVHKATGTERMWFCSKVAGREKNINPEIYRGKENLIDFNWWLSILKRWAVKYCVQNSWHQADTSALQLMNCMRYSHKIHGHSRRLEPLNLAVYYYLDRKRPLFRSEWTSIKRLFMTKALTLVEFFSTFIENKINEFFWVCLNCLLFWNIIWV